MEDPIFQLIVSYYNIFIVIYVVIALIFSSFYGLYAENIFYTKNQKEKIKEEYDSESIKYFHFHQHWLNFVGSCIGWFSLYLFISILQKVEVKEISFANILLLIIGVIGIVGWLPMTLWGVTKSLADAVKRVIDKITG